MGNLKNKIDSKEIVNDLSNCANAFISNYKSDFILTEFGSNSKVVGIVIKGEIEIIREDEFGNRTILEKLTENSIFAEQLTYFKEDHIYVISKTDCTIMILNYDFLLKRCARNCDNHNQLVSKIAELLIERSNLLSQRIDILSRKTIEEKLMAYFKTFKQYENKIFIPYSYSNLAEYLCVDRSNMMRELKNMENKKLIKRDKNEIELLY